MNPEKPEFQPPENEAQLERLQKEYALKILLELYASLGHTARKAVGREIHKITS